jgi:hypothetical protein
MSKLFGSNGGIEGRRRWFSPNWCLQATNVIMGGLAISSIFAFVDRFDDAKDTFWRLHRLAPTHPHPCALATPDGVELSYLAGKWSHSPLDVFMPATAKLHDDMRAALCANSNIYGFLKHLMDNATTMVTARDDTSTELSPTWQTAENKFLELVCYGESQNTEVDTFGDVRGRIGRAYVHSHAAFVKYTTGCTWAAGADPFASATTCTHNAVVKAELLAAAQDQAAFGAKLDATTGEMMYRLAALAVLSYNDRNGNAAGCFSNPGTHNASVFCQSIYDELEADIVNFPQVAAPPAPAPRTVNNEVLPPYEAAVRARDASMQTCANAVLSAGTQTNPPSPPPTPNTLFVAAHDMGKTDAVLTCTHTLEWGLMDIRRLFGVPDPRGPFEVHTSYVPGLIDIIYSGAGLSNMKKVTFEEYARRDNELRQYASYRMVATAVMASLTNWAMGFFLGRASIPFFVFLTIRFCRVKSEVTGFTQKLVPPPPRLPFWIAIFVGLFAWLWAFFVDPTRHFSPFYVDGSCETWKKAAIISAPWMTPDGYDSTRNTGINIWFVLFIPIWAILYNTQCRSGNASKKEMSRMRRYLNPKDNPTAFALIPQAVLMTMLGLTAVYSSEQWFVVAVRDEMQTNPGDLEAEDFTNDLTALVFASVFSGWLIGAMTRRWAATQSPALVKLPYLLSVGFATAFPFIQNSILLTAANDRSRELNSTGDNPRYVYYIIGIVCQGLTLMLAFFVFQSWLSGDGIPQTAASEVPVAGENAPVAPPATVTGPTIDELLRSGAYDRPRNGPGNPFVSSRIAGDDALSFKIETLPLLAMSREGER